MDDLADRLHRHVDRLAGLIGPRHHGRPQALEAAVRLIETEFSAAGYRVERETYVAGGREVSNLVAELKGEGPGVVVAGAHYDTVPSTPGADDNASGVAVLLEVARLLRDHRPGCTLRFVAFACEEMPFFTTQEMGSRVHARGCRARGEKVVGMLSLEMLGYYTTAPQQLPAAIPGWLRWMFPKTGDFLAAVGNLGSGGLLRRFKRGFRRATELPLFGRCLPEALGEIRLSDNSSFWDQGYPALMVTDTSFLRNPHYHEPTDTPETLDYGRMAKAALGLAGAVQEIGAARP
ncbi:MAG TPA: M20/M25/M40 family metallo-hydrolase [Planctomycetota bacterium]|nr:M20/M25/M40 family metallo-hydrolase [Planctomycetota bacterium]